jgi:hypothetical protein
VKLWTWRFVAAFIVLVTFVLDAIGFNRHWFGVHELTGRPKHMLPRADTGVASFIFLLVALYVISHAGSWVLAAFRRRGQEPNGKQREEGRRRRRKKR